MSIIVGKIVGIVGDNIVDVEIESVGSDYLSGEILRIEIGQGIPRPLGCQYTADFLVEKYLGKKVHCIVKTQGNSDVVEAIEFSLI